MGIREFRVKIKEFLSCVVAVEAASEEEAIEAVEEKYASGEIVLDSSNFDFQEIDVTGDPVSDNFRNSDEDDDDDDDDDEGFDISGLDLTNIVLKDDDDDEEVNCI